MQKRDVKGQRNPPLDAKYRDTQNRGGGYADYKVGKVYFSFDEVAIMRDDKYYPTEDLSLSEILHQDKEVLSEEEKVKQRTLIFYQCQQEDHLMDILRERKIAGEEVKVERMERIGNKQDKRIQPLRVVFQGVKETEEIYVRREGE